MPSASRRRLRIVKLRGTAFTEGFHDFVIIRGGLTVFPQLVPGGDAHARNAAPLASGVTQLDSMRRRPH